MRRSPAILRRPTITGRNASSRVAPVPLSPSLSRFQTLTRTTYRQSGHQSRHSQALFSVHDARQGGRERKDEGNESDYKPRSSSACSKRCSGIGQKMGSQTDRDSAQAFRSVCLWDSKRSELRSELSFQNEIVLRPRSPHLDEMQHG